MRDLSIDYLRLNQLTPNPDNPRGHSRKQIRVLAASIKHYGFVVPIVIDANNMIVAGHGRLEAAHELGMQTVPVIRVDHLDENQLRAFRIADNKVAEMSHWMPDRLAAEFKHLLACGVELETNVAFSTAEIDIVLGQAAEKHGPDLAPEDALPSLPDGRATVSKTGDCWLLGEHRLLTGDICDASDLGALMDGDRARMVITDPPYNVPVDGFVTGKGAVRHAEFAMASGEMNKAQFVVFLRRALANFAQTSANGAILFVFMDWRHLAELFEAGEAEALKLMNLICWTKTNAGMGTFYRSQHELAAVFKSGDDPHINNFELGQGGRYRTNVWSYRGANAFGPTRKEDLAGHPTVKPAVMFADAIKDVSKRGDVVLDGFGGSGTTLIAAEMTGRRARVMELEPKYVDLTVRRWQRLTGYNATHAATGISFDEHQEQAGLLQGTV